MEEGGWAIELEMQVVVGGEPYAFIRGVGRVGLRKPGRRASVISRESTHLDSPAISSLLISATLFSWLGCEKKWEDEAFLVAYFFWQISGWYFQVKGCGSLGRFAR